MLWRGWLRVRDLGRHTWIVLEEDRGGYDRVENLHVVALVGVVRSCVVTRFESEW